MDEGSDEDEDSEDDWEEVEGKVSVLFSKLILCLLLGAKSHVAILFFFETKTRYSCSRDFF